MKTDFLHPAVSFENPTNASVLVPGLSSVRLGAFAELRNTSCDGYVSIDRYSTVNRAEVGAYFGVACQSYVGRCRAGRYIEIGSRCSIGPFNHPTTWLSTGVFQYKDPRDCWDADDSDGYHLEYEPEKTWSVLGNDVWVGDNAVILAGVEVGTGAIVAAGSVVTRDVPPYAIVAGNPARVVRSRFPATIVERLLESRWWELAIGQLSGIDFANVELALEQIGDRMASGPGD